MLCFQRITFLKVHTHFYHLPESALISLCTHFQEHVLHAGTEKHFSAKDAHRLFIVFNGNPRYVEAQQEQQLLEKGDFIGEFSIYKSDIGSRLIVDELCILLSIEKQTVFALLAANPKNSKYILNLVKKEMRQRVGDLVG